MGDDSVFSKGLISEALPTASDDDEWRGHRQTRRNELYTQPIGNWRQARAREHSYFIAHNPTIDAATTLVGHAAALVGDADATLTKPLIHLMMPSGTDVLAELDFIEIDVIVAAANGTTAEWTAQLDTGPTRVTSAGTSFTRLSPNMRATETPNLAVQGGVITAGAESANCRVLGNGLLRKAIEFAGDRITFKFGGEPGSGSNVVAGAASRHLVAMPPVILGETDQFLLALYAAASQDTAGIYRVRLGWSER